LVVVSGGVASAFAQTLRRTGADSLYPRLLSGTPCGVLSVPIRRKGTPHPAFAPGQRGEGVLSDADNPGGRDAARYVRQDA
jgi:hypothetical protein